EPAGAWTMKERCGSSARRHCAESGASAIALFRHARRRDRQPLAHAAEGLLVAGLARLRAVAWIDVRVAERIGAADGLERRAPLRVEIVPTAVLPRGRAALFHGVDVRQEALVPRQALEAELAGLHAGECDRVDALLRSERVHRQLRLVRAFA